MDNVTRRPLPRSLSPLEGESLAGYILRLAHRLERSPTRIGHLTGLAPYRKSKVTHFPAHQIVTLRARVAAEFAAAVRVTPEEVAELGLRCLAPEYPPLFQAGLQNDGRVVYHPWAFMAASRYCPKCLIGDRSGIQYAHGGPWLRRWHLPVIFACTRHGYILNHECPKCQRLANESYQGRASLILHPNSEVAHPARCRNQDAEASARSSYRRILCGADLRHGERALIGLPSDQMAQYLALQKRIEHHLNPAHGNPDYFRDLVTVAQLIQVSWPQSMDLASLPSPARDLLDGHVERVRMELAERRPGGPRYRELFSPPSQPLLCAALLLQADRLVSLDTPADLREAMQELASVSIRQNGRRFARVINKSPPSDRLARALAPQRRGFNAGRGSQGALGRLRVPSRDIQFSVSHVPQLIPTAWYQRHFQEFVAQLTVPQRGNGELVRRAASLKLVEMVSGGTLPHCAEVLGIPIGFAGKTRSQLWRRCPESAWVLFQRAVEGVALDLEQDSGRIDFARRREQLADWEIPGSNWMDLTHDLPRLQTAHHRTVGSVIVWTALTEGDYLFSPLLRANGVGARLPGSKVFIKTLGAYRSVGRGGRSILLRRIAGYAEEVASRCDSELSISV
ncbi:TniQ family protein [Streptomyces shaanxiensis]